MAKLIYSVIASLDGYIADEDGNFDWAAPDEEVHTFFNDLERPVGTYLYGRRMYEVMRAWDHPEAFADQSPAMLDFASIWRPTSSSTPGRWRRWTRPGRGSSGTSTPRPSGG
jgi:RibD C-terminal domain